VINLSGIALRAFLAVQNQSGRQRNIVPNVYETELGKQEDRKNNLRNGADGISDIEGKATRVGASERGQRASFKSADNSYLIENSDNNRGRFCTDTFTPCRRNLIPSEQNREW
jgi:hypothetical protein